MILTKSTFSTSELGAHAHIVYKKVQVAELTSAVIRVPMKRYLYIFSWFVFSFCFAFECRYKRNTISFYGTTTTIVGIMIIRIAMHINETMTS